MRITRSRCLRLGAAAAVATVAAGCTLSHPPAAVGEMPFIHGHIPLSVAFMGDASVRDGVRQAYAMHRPDVDILWLVTGRPSDVRLMIPPIVPHLSGLLPLDQMLKDANFVPGTLLPAVADAFRYGGLAYGVPSSLQIMGFSWSPALFNQARVPAPDDHWDVGAFRGVAQAILSAGGGVLNPVIGGVDFRFPWVWAALMAGEGIQSFANGVFNLTQTGAVTAARTLVDLVRAYGWNGKAPGAVGDQMALRLTTSWWAAAGSTVTPLPRLQRPVQPVVPYGLGIYADCARPDVALDFILWLNTAAPQRLLTQVGVAPAVSDPTVWAGWLGGTAQVGHRLPAWVTPDALAPILVGWPAGDVTWPSGGTLVPAGPGPCWAAMAAALDAAVTGPDRLPTLLATAQRETNAALPSLHASASPPDVYDPGARVIRPISSWQPPSGSPVAPTASGDPAV